MTSIAKSGIVTQRHTNRLPCLYPCGSRVHLMSSDSPHPQRGAASVASGDSFMTIPYTHSSCAPTEGRAATVCVIPSVTLAIQRCSLGADGGNSVKGAPLILRDSCGSSHPCRFTACVICWRWEARLHFPPEFWLYLWALSLVSHERQDKLEGFLKYFSQAWGVRIAAMTRRVDLWAVGWFHIHAVGAIMTD